MRWLQYHDRDTADLCGTLPLAVGMPVALTYHLDRSPDKMLLKGSVGRVHSWVWPENDQQAHRPPTCVYVKFEGAAWKLEGIDEPGVYPVRPRKEDWYLDSRRKTSLLKVKRRQIPLTPAFAITAHSSQGKTLRAIMLDLHVDKRVDTTIGAVGASRVRTRYDCLILRPFPLWLFRRGVSEGPQLLLQLLQGEKIDWAAYAEGFAPYATCAKCQQVKTLDGYEHEQWDKIRANLPAWCMQCKHRQHGPRSRKLDTAIRYLCCGCNLKKIEDAFPRAQLRQDSGKKCLSCCKATSELTCSQCGDTKLVDEFYPSMVTFPVEGLACKDCQEEAKRDSTRAKKDGLNAVRAYKFYQTPLSLEKHYNGGASIAQPAERAKRTNTLSATRTASASGTRSKGKLQRANGFAQTAAADGEARCKNKGFDSSCCWCCRRLCSEKGRDFCT